MLITLDSDGVLMKNPFSTAVFPIITKQLGGKARPIAQRGDDPNPERGKGQSGEKGLCGCL